eukprot:s603_g20.t1
MLYKWYPGLCRYVACVFAILAIEDPSWCWDAIEVCYSCSISATRLARERRAVCSTLSQPKAHDERMSTIVPPKAMKAIGAPMAPQHKLY